MKKNLIAYLFCFLFATALLAQSRSESRLHILNATSDETVLRLNLSGVDRIAVQTPLGQAEIIGIDQGTPLLEKGAPDVPKYAAALQIPAQGNMAVEILAAAYDDYPGVEVAPSKGNLKRNINPEEISYEYGKVYGNDAFFPGALAALKTPFILRDNRGQALWLFPVQYNPVQKVMRVYRSVTVRVYAAGGTGINELPGNSPHLKSRVFDQLQHHFFVNTGKRIDNRGGDPRPPEKMLVITRDNLLEELEPLLTWKRQSGIHTTVVPVSAIGASGSQAVYDFVKNYYAEHGITYLLLVGDDNAIEPEMRQDGDFFACDNCFGYLEGDDFFPEVLVGRLHAATPEQLRIMVNRNLEYEKYPPPAPGEYWYATGMAACSNEGAGIGDDNQADWQHGNEWKTKNLADGYEEYWEFYDGWHGPDSPTPGHYTADKTGNPANGPLVDLMNDRGVSLFNYTGHGWDQGLSSGDFSTDAVAGLRNRYRYPILIAVACSAGNFTNGECLGEAWQRAGDPATGEAWGGIAGFFSSDLQSWSPPMEGQDGMNQYLIDADGVMLSPTLCGMLAFGNATMIAAYGSAGEQMAGFWNPFAEPSTVPRTRLPQPLAASHVSSVSVETTSLTINCSVEGALISLYWQNQTWAAANVENGVATLEFEQLNNIGPLTVTVSQFNYLPYQGTITVEPAAQPLVAAQRFELDDATSGNNNQQADFGEKAALKVVLQNIGAGLASGITATLSTADPYVFLTGDALTAPDLLSNDSTVVLFPITIGDDAPNGRQVTFTLKIICNNGVSLIATTTLRLNAPVLETGAWSIDDSAGGNGNKRLENGETAVLRIANRNAGGSDSPDALGILSSDSPWLAVSDAVPLGVLNGPSGPKEAMFLLSVAPNAPLSAVAALHYRLQAGHYVSETEIAPLVLNPVVETFETNNFYSFFWQMSGDKPWQTTASYPYSGKYCARSGVITHGQQSGMEIQLLVSDEGIVSFARRVSSEPGFDRLRFLVDSVEMGAWSGEVPWEEVSFPVSPGQHKFIWIYEKDDLTSSGADRAWLDEIILPPHQIAVYTDAPAPDAGFAAVVAPNPTSGSCIIQIDLPEEQQLCIRVFDQLGRELHTAFPPGLVLPGRQEYGIDLGNCAPGIYYVDITGAKKRTVLRVARAR